MSLLYFVKWTQMLSSFEYWEPLQLFNDLKVHQNITIQIPEAVGHSQIFFFFKNSDKREVTYNKLCPNNIAISI